MRRLIWVVWRDGDEDLSVLDITEPVLQICS
jgi:hypothetical protein